MAQQDIREYGVQARNTDVFGRVLCSARDHHFIVDGPIQNGCPGEAITPAEVFLSGVAACGVELVQVLARQNSVPLQSVSVDIHGMMDRSRPAHPKFTVFNAVRVHFRLSGLSREQGEQLVESFKGR
jgi:uncharacterized OsmC-like protein